MSGSVGSAFLTPNELLVARSLRYQPQAFEDAHQNALLQGQELALRQQEFGLKQEDILASREAARAAIARMGGGAPGPQSSATPPDGGGASGATIGQRQNNPGNLAFAGQPGASPGQGNRFASFPDMPSGVAANANQLALYQTQHGINTVRGAVTRWVSDPKANLTSYTDDIAKALGVGADDPIDLTDPTVQAKFIQAQFPHESAGGGYVLNPADVQKGVQMAAAQRGQRVQVASGTAPAPSGGAPQQQASAAPVAPSGVAARTGGTDVASVAPMAPGTPPGPAAEAPPTQLAPPAPPAAPQAPGLTPPPQLGPMGLTHDDVGRFTDQLIHARKPELVHQIINEMEATKTRNLAAQHQYQQDMYQRQRDAQTDAHTAEAARLARAKEDREAVEQAKPFHGNTPDAQNRNILIEGTKSGKTDTTEYASAWADYATEKVDANGLKYRPDMSPYDPPTGKVYGANSGRDLGKADVGQGPLAPPVINTAMMGNQAGLRNINRALKELDAHPDSVGAKGIQPDWLIQRTDPEGVKLRADIADILSQVFHERSGAAVMASEAVRLKPFTPGQTDTAKALRAKLERMREIYHEVLLDHYTTYGPEGGGRKLPRVEAALKETGTSDAAPELPPAAASSLKGGHETTFGNGQVWTLQDGKPVKVR